MSKIEQEEKYPVASVILIYGFLGGAVGGLIVALYFFVESFFVGVFSIMATLISIPVFTLGGVIYGFIPAVCAGIWLAVIKFTVTKKSDYFKIAIIGYLSYFFYFFISVFIKGNISDFIDSDFIFSSVWSIAPLSAMILGRFVLPKQRELSEK